MKNLTGCLKIEENVLKKILQEMIYNVNRKQLMLRDTGRLL